MKYFDVHYRYKETRRGFYTITVKAINEKDARRIAYNKIDNRVFELI